VFIEVDHFSKFTLLKGMREATSAGVIRFLRQEVFNKFGVPELLQSDNGKQFVYQLARRLKAFEDNELYVLPRESRIALMREEIRRNSQKAYERRAAVYNRRSRNVRFAVGQEVYRKNFTFSNFGQNYNAKFTKKFFNCRIKSRIGNNMYETETLHGKPSGIYHAKDLKQ